MRRVYACWAAIAIAAGLARAQTVRDPLDGVTSVLPTPLPWNRAGGEDPDGCVHSVDPDGRWRIAGLDDVVAFPRSGLAIARARLGAAFSPEQAAAVRELLRRAPPAGPPLAQRHALAAEVGLLLDGDPLQAADLYLRAAWAVRGAVEIPSAVDFRPRDPEEGFARLTELERDLDREQSQVHGIDRILDLLDDARRDLGRLTPPSVAGRLAREELRQALFAVEQEALRLKAELPPEVQGPAPAERYVLLAWAAQRLGLREVRDRWLRRASAAFGERQQPRVQALEAAFTAEDALLARAGELYAQALAAGLDPASEARAACLLGETQRRRGLDPATAYARAAAAAPDAPGGRRARQLLERLR
ncbi:MAG: hypothetical protein R3F62_22080 [Planctomycetota bacterium]